MERRRVARGFYSNWSYTWPPSDPLPRERRGRAVGEQLFHLRQERRSAQDYALEFRTLAAGSGWNDRALIDHYRCSLWEDVRRELACWDTALSLDELIDMSIRLDNLLAARGRSERVLPGSQNVKADALSRLYDTEDRSTEPTPILPASRLVATVVWEVDSDIERALRAEPAPPQCPAGRKVRLLGTFLEGSYNPSPFHNGHALQTAEALFTHVFRHYGVPEDIVSDRGPQFTSRVWRAFMERLAVSVSLTSGYHPESNGQVERVNQEMDPTENIGINTQGKTGDIWKGVSTIPKSGKTDQGVTETAYREEVRVLRVLSQENNLSFNVNETKEMIVDFRKKQMEHPPIHIEGTAVEKVESFKFFGVHITGLSAAFNIVNHQILLSTLSGLWVSGSAHSWIPLRSYQVTLRGSVSASHTLTTGGGTHLCVPGKYLNVDISPPPQTQLNKTELLFLQGKACLLKHFSITIDNSEVSPSQSAKNLGVTLDNILSFSANIKAVTRSCMLYNICRLNWLSFFPGVSPIHNGQVCSTWGNYHFKTFDGDIFQLPSTCNYVVTSLCHSSYEDFNIQMRRQVVDNQPTISKITMKLDGTVVELSKGSVVVNGNNATLPFSQSGILIEETPSYIKIKAKLGLVAIWNQDDSFLVEMDIKFRNKTCGLCGDFNAIQQFDEFYSHGMKLSAVDFGNFWKLDGPTESCTENILPSNQKCPNLKPVCEQLLSGPAFSSCKDLLAIDSFVEACVSDLCHCDNSTNSFCLCNTISEYSRQCVHAGGKPKQWRTEQFCYKTCPFNMEYQECGNPCVDTCSNPERGQLCEEHCSDGCFCPPGTVFDDVNKNGCIALSQCSCRHNGKTYAPGESYSSTCKDCSCAGGQWKCVDKDCPGTCAVEGGSHINTYDGKTYTFHGDCSYVLTKDCDGMQFTVLGDLVQCGLSDSETCLKAVTLSLSEGATVINIQPNGKAFVNGIYSQLPFSAAGVTIFRASSFFIIVQTTFGLQLEIQLSPIMQVYIAASIVWQQRTCGLCGNFNNNQGDDFKVLSGVTEGTAIGFANTWKTRASCPDVKSSFESPCSLSLDNEKYAQHWCSQLADPKGLFAKCHTAISPDMYKENCMYDSCNCEKSEDCMCAAVSSYVHACAAEGIQLNGWRDTICNKYSTSCPSTMVYSYSIKNSDRSCRCYSDSDFTCSITFEPVDGCVCSEGTYLDDEGKCVPPASCPCYYKGSVVSPGEVISKDGTMCTCKEGKLRCIGDSPDQPSCVAPMVFFNCSNASPGVRGLECQKSCNILDMACISTECISGCMCPSGLVSDGKGGCIKPDLCPCSHNGATYQPGDRIKVDCNTCTCKDRKWQCTTNLCLGTCAIYGDGHYITFDGKRFTFEGDCEYTLTKDYCGSNNANGSFRVITENIPCGTTGTTCSKAIKLFLGNNELILTDGNYQVVERNTGEAVPYQIRTMGIYLVIEANNGLILMWDRKTSMFIKLNPQFKGHVCGLCGNYDGNANNDFTTRSQAVVVNPLDFGNSWKVSASCPDAKNKRSPCTANPYRQSWSQKQCSIIQSNVFTDCHSKVDPSPFYDACVTDSCACDSGGDCECFCTAVAAYAEACNEAGACIAWRSPQICPLFCDYYNPPGECEWHYKACGAQCMKTCRNPSGSCSTQIPPLEGCYPKCPPAQPFFDEDIMKCVEKEQCGCYGRDGKHYNNGEKVPTTENCQTCYCNSVTVDCKYDVQACTCTYNGNKYPNGHIIYHTTNGHGSCITAICGKNGTTQRDIYPCSTTTPTLTPSVPNSTPFSTVTTTVFTFLTPTTAPTTTSTSTETTVSPTTFTTTCGYPYLCTSKPTTISPTTTRPPVTTKTTNATTSTISTTTLNTKPPNCTVCEWSPWYNVDYPQFGPGGGDNESIKKILESGKHICEKPVDVMCQAVRYPGIPLSELGQNVDCNTKVGLICQNKDQGIPPICLDYEIKVKCCKTVKCHTTTPVQTTKPTVTTTTMSASTLPTTTSKPTTITTPPTSTLPLTTTTTPTTTPTPNTTILTSTTPPTTSTTVTPITTPTPTTKTSTSTVTSTTKTTTQTPSPSTTLTTTPTSTSTGVTPTTTTHIPTTTTTTTGPHITTPTPTTTTSTSTAPPTTKTTTQTPSPGTTLTTTPTSTSTGVTPTTTHIPTTTTTTTGPHITTPTPTTTTSTSTAPPTTKTTTQTPSPSTTLTTTPTSTSTGVTPTTTTTTGPHITTPTPTTTTSTSTAPPTTKTTTQTPSPSTTLTTTPTTTTTTGPHITTPTPTTTTSTSTAPPTTKTTTQTPSPGTTLTTTPTSTSTGVTPTTCGGEEKCVWSDWINLAPPTTKTTTQTPSPGTTLTTTPTSTSTGVTPTTCGGEEKCVWSDWINLGSIVYNVSDHDGWCYIGLCNKTCEIETHLTSCGTSTTPVTPTSPTTSQPPTITVPHVTYPSEKNCDHDHPPRQNGDSWKHNQCTNGTCTNGKVSYEHVHCETPKPITCENNYPPIQVFDESGCCFHYECQCICYGWGDPHYVTFDGTYYGFQGNCSYVLVKEILPKYNFSVVIDNYYCDAPDGLSCPQSLTIYYQSYKIFMTKKDVDGDFTSLIYVNQKRIIPAYETKDFRITDNGIETLLVIPAINAKVSFTGLMFSIYLPWDKFSGNTEGQCGTCDNNRTDDCRLPNGTIDSSCPDMAHQWHVADHNNSQCTPPPPEPTPPRGCDPPICHLIQSKVFESCHKIIPYEPFLVACIFDACNMDDVTIGCTSLQTYADACAQAGVCIEWRNYTNGQCDFTCEKPKVYKACGPQVEPTCNAWYNFKFIQTQNEFSVMGDIQLEGCYCPPGTTLMSSSSNYCIPSCDICPLPNGEWKEANETWVSNCQECVCDPYSLEIQCQPMACQHQPPLTCDQEGQVKVVETVDCCQKDKCECDVTRCSTSKITCPVGFETEATMGVCCLTYQCVPKDVCVFNNTEYQPGANVPEDKCKNCVCGDSVDAQSHLHIIECHPTECDTHCQQGYDHQAVPGQCCGKCVQTSCVVMLPDNTTHTIQPGSIWIPSGNKCLKYECVKIQDQLIPIEAKTVCPVFHPEDCVPGTEVIAPDGCCHGCIPITKPCNVTKSKVYLDSNGCKSANTVEVTTCSGSCVTYAMYSLEANMMERSCTCCREESTTKKEVEMICPDGSKFNHSYIHINKCGCQRTECVTPEETQVTRSRRRRR
ncbi:mucin-5B-like [Oncorhynchus clarkii lewisi]|uniref:mucin-5B-like n=1 Tax=Oncorhynchus clarkii lewisi TaxID=490388 RepID=UPI0039B8988E